MFDIVSFLVAWLTLFGIYAILALCLNMEIGYAGMANFGLVVFWGIGAFIAGYVSLTLFMSYYGLNYPIYSLDAIIAMGEVSGSDPLLHIGTFLLSLIISFLVSGVVGYLVSYPTLRVGPAFLGITILSFGEMMRVFMRHFKPTGAAYGLLGVPNPFAWIPDPGLKAIMFLLLTLTILVGVFAYFRSSSNSPFGRVLRSIRDDEVASLCVGKPVPAIKAKLLFVASGISGVSGSLYAFYTGSVTPDMFVTAVTFEVWSMVILGGRGNNMGALLGALVLSLMNRASSVFNFVFPDFIVDPNYIRWMLVGAIIFLVLMYKPKGLIAEKPVNTEAWDVFEGAKERPRLLSRVVKKAREGVLWLAGREAK